MAKYRAYKSLCHFFPQLVSSYLSTVLIFVLINILIVINVDNV